MIADSRAVIRQGIETMNNLTTKSAGALALSQPEISALVERKARELRYEGISGWSIQHPLAPQQVKLLEERYRTLTVRLRPMEQAMAEMDHARKDIAATLGGYPQLHREGAGAAQMVAGFVTLLRSFPLFAITEVCEDLQHGRVAEVNPNHPPTAPMIARLAEAKVEPYRTEQGRIRNLLDAKVRERPMSDEERARARQKGIEVVEMLRASTERLEAQDRLKARQEREQRQQRNDQMKREAWAKIGMRPVYRYGEMIWPRQAGQQPDVETTDPAGRETMTPQLRKLIEEQNRHRAAMSPTDYGD